MGKRQKKLIDILVDRGYQERDEVFYLWSILQWFADRWYEELNMDLKYIKILSEQGTHFILFLTIRKPLSQREDSEYKNIIGCMKSIEQWKERSFLPSKYN
jgi:lipopolysaccharide/colanic/teichoic acid biosynthesis glycosyltransferase